ncbi:hypothetical protein [Denitromonas iodatirespirans]|uniref:Phage tail protein n=1 Tax=Denitromonas iodatirespirans TaxID=2795389 RepID=A0A944D8A9_DENI1|nr:hypothetical protein [Denitromonas iodatirespirans]MBT0961670.1 hypothetical protein [Denitromonas iodatirespirans]
MDIYHYHPDSGEFIGVSIADPSPLEPGTYLIPAFATSAPPPEPELGKIAAWVGGAWRLDPAPAPQPPIEPPEPTEPTEEEIIAELAAAVQSHLDTAARAVGYDSIASAVTYAEEPAVAKFQAEGRTFRAWRSLVWEACYQIMADVQSNARPIPSAAELIAELPALVLP